MSRQDGDYEVVGNCGVAWWTGVESVVCKKERQGVGSWVVEEKERNRRRTGRKRE